MAPKLIIVDTPRHQNVCIFSIYDPTAQNLDTGYPHDGRSVKDYYPHDGRADKDSYPHDRHNQYIVLSL